MARPLFTQEQVFEVADGLAAEGKEVSALALLSKLGGASLTTIYKHLLAWRDARKQDTAQGTAQAIPESVQAVFATALGRTWAAATSEAAREITAAKEQAAQDVATATRQFEEAMQAIEKLEEQSDVDTARIEALNSRVVELETAVQKSENDQAALAATTEQLQHQVKALEAEKAKADERAEAAYKAREEAATEAAQALGNALGQLEALKEQNHVLAKLAERGKQGNK